MPAHRRAIDQPRFAAALATQKVWTSRVCESERLRGRRVAGEERLERELGDGDVDRGGEMGKGRQQRELAVGGTEPEWDGVAEVVRVRATPLGDDLLDLGDYCVEPLVGVPSLSS